MHALDGLFTNPVFEATDSYNITSAGSFVRIRTLDHAAVEKGTATAEKTPPRLSHPIPPNQQKVLRDAEVSHCRGNNPPLCTLDELYRLIGNKPYNKEPIFTPECSINILWVNIINSSVGIPVSESRFPTLELRGRSTLCPSPPNTENIFTFHERLLPFSKSKTGSYMVCCHLRSVKYLDFNKNPLLVEDENVTRQTLEHYSTPVLHQPSELTFICKKCFYIANHPTIDPTPTGRSG